MDPAFGHAIEFIVSKLGWMLFHAVWQIALIAIAFALCRMFLSAMLPNCRARASACIYVAGCVSLVLMIMAPAATLLLQSDEATTARQVDTTLFPELVDPFVIGSSASRFLELPNPEVTPADINALQSTSVAKTPGWRVQAAKKLEAGLAGLGFDWRTLQPWFVVCWLLGVALFSLRPMIGVLAIKRLRESMSLKLSDSLAQLTGRISREFNLPSLQFAISDMAQTPMVVGFFRPVVLLPVSILTELSTQQIELILRHELAHVRRNDVLVNLIQIGVESMFFFHPCMWFVSGVVRQERENCCDDVAVTGGHAKQYADALLTIESSRQPALAMGSNGVHIA